MTDLPEERRRRADFEATWASPAGFPQGLAAVNYQVIGRRFMATAFAFLVLGGALALLLRTQLAASELELVSPERFNQLFTMHGSTMMYLFAVPFLEGLAVTLIPLMVGSRDLAFPRLTAFGYWTFLFGGILFYSSWIVDAVPDSGWFAYTPLSGSRFSGPGQDLWLVGLALVEVAGITAAVEIVVTILKLRAPGMSLQRMPIFAWTMLVTGVMIVFAFTVLLTATLLLELDRTVGTRFFDPVAGGSSLLWQHLFWFFGHPEVYIAFLPATGIVSQIVPVAAGRRLVAYELVVAATILMGFLSFGLWVHHMFVAGLPELSKTFFTGASLLIALASGTQIFAWIATLWGSAPRFDAHLLFVLGFFFVFTLGGLTGVMVASVPFDAQVHDTYFVVAHLHYVLIGGVVFPILAALHFWAPSFVGRRLHEGVGRATFWVIFLAFNATFFPMHWMGFLGLPRRVYTYPSELGLDGWNLVSTISAWVLGLGFLAVAGNVLWSARRGPTEGDPWEADGLEWSAGAPPPGWSFLAPPRVLGRHARWNEDHPLDPRTERAREALTGAPHDWRGTLVTDAVDATPQAVLQLPGPNPAPILVAFALLAAGVGVLVKSPSILVVALVASGIGVARWLAPDPAYVGRARTSDLGEEAGVELFPDGTRALAWWGMVGTLVSVGTGFLCVLVGYAYLWLEAGTWPPSGFALPNALLWALPFALPGVAAPLMATAKPAADRGDRAAVWQRIGVAVGVAALALVAHLVLLATVPFSWTEHAFASAFWTLHGAFLLLQGVLVAFAVGVGVTASRADDPAPLVKAQMASLAFTFQALLGGVIFAVVHLAPRWIGGGP